MNKRITAEILDIYSSLLTATVGVKADTVDAEVNWIKGMGLSLDMLSLKNQQRPMDLPIVSEETLFSMQAALSRAVQQALDFRDIEIDMPVVLSKGNRTCSDFTSGLMIPESNEQMSVSA